MRTVLETYGGEGGRWLDDIPQLVAACESRLGVRVTGVVPRLGYNLVLWAEADGGAPAVLKLSVREAESRAELDALTVYAGATAVRVLACWAERGALLLERAIPGTPLGDLESDDRRAMEAVATIAHELWVDAPELLPRAPRVEGWARGFERLRRRFAGGTGPLPAALVERAEALFRELLASAPPPVLLHGDLHYGNVLAAERRPWLAIDPKGVLGEPAFDAGYLLANPSRHLVAGPTPPRRVLADRVTPLPDALGLDRGRVVAYAFAQSMLSAWWSVEDHGAGWEQAVSVAEWLTEHL